MNKSDMIYAFYVWPLVVIGVFAVGGLVCELISYSMEEDKDEQL
jgi:hypothetical protein